MGESLKLARAGPVATVTMARPEVHNAFNEALIASLRASPEDREGVTAFLEKRKPKWAPDVETPRRGVSDAAPSKEASS